MKPEDYFKPGSVAFIQAQEAINVINAAKAAGLPEAEQYERSFMASLDLVKKNRSWSGFDANRKAIAGLAPQINSIAESRNKQTSVIKGLDNALALSREIGNVVAPETLARLDVAKQSGDINAIESISKYIDDTNKSAQDRNARLTEERSKAEMATPSTPKKTVGDISFEQNSKAALRYADELTAAINKYGTFETYDSKGAAKLGQLPYQMAIAYAKTVDPTSVAREGEVDAAKKYLIPMGMFTRKETALAAASEFKKDIEARVKEYNATTGVSAEATDTATEEDVTTPIQKANKEANDFFNRNR